MTIHGYCRVSTARQAEDGESLSVQRRTLEGYALMHGMPDIEFHIERGVSGSVPFGQRPEGMLLLQSLKPGDVIIAPKLDRMFRSALDALEMLKHLKSIQVQLHLLDLGGDVTNGGISQLIFTILAAVAEAERDRIRERIRTVKQDQAKQGAYLGGKVPFGFILDENRKLILDPAQSHTIELVKAAAASGKSTRAIAEAIGGISHSTVAKILRS